MIEVKQSTVLVLLELTFPFLTRRSLNFVNLPHVSPAGSLHYLLKAHVHVLAGGGPLLWFGSTFKFIYPKNDIKIEVWYLMHAVLESRVGPSFLASNVFEAQSVCVTLRLDSPLAAVRSWAPCRESSGGEKGGITERCDILMLLSC